MSVRAEIEHQQSLDRRWGNTQITLAARIAAVAEAQRALARREPGARVADLLIAARLHERVAGPRASERDKGFLGKTTRGRAGEAS